MFEQVVMMEREISFLSMLGLELLKGAFRFPLIYSVHWEAERELLYKFKSSLSASQNDPFSVCKIQCHLGD